MRGHFYTLKRNVKRSKELPTACASGRLGLNADASIEHTTKAVAVAGFAVAHTHSGAMARSSVPEPSS